VIGAAQAKREYLFVEMAGSGPKSIEQTKETVT
jgi:hypothetical protein